MSTTATIKENDVFVTAMGGGSHRRVIAIVSGIVCYSTGGDINRLCKIKTFCRWATNRKAKRVFNGH